MIDVLVDIWTYSALLFFYLNKDNIEYLDFKYYVIIVIATIIGVYFFNETFYIYLESKTFFLNFYNYLIYFILMIIGYKLNDIINHKDKDTYYILVCSFYIISFTWIFSPLYFYMF